MTLGESIRAARLSKGMSQYALAAKLGITQAALSYIENNVNIPRIETLNDMSKILGVKFITCNNDGTKVLTDSSKYLKDVLSVVLRTHNVTIQTPQFSVKLSKDDNISIDVTEGKVTINIE